MAKKKENLKGTDTASLKAMLVKHQEEMRSIRFKAEGTRSKNVKEGQALKKQLARVLTALNAVK